MNHFAEIESFRYVKAARRLLSPITERLESLQKNDCSDELKFEALLSLGKIGNNDSLPVLIKAFEEYPDYIEPITALGHLRSSTPVAKLIERLKDPDALYKEEIVRVLGEIGDPMAARTLMELLHDEDRMVRYYSARALYKMGGRDVVQSLCSLLNDPDEWIVINVLEILSKMNDPEAVPALVGQFEVARDSRLKAIIISSLSTFAEGRLLKTFESGLASFDPRIQANSVEAISRLKIPALEMKRKLKKFYGHPNNRVRGNVCIALASADTEAVEEEISLMLVSKDASTRRSAAYVLSKIESENRISYIHKLLQDENFGVRKMALKAALELEGNVGLQEITPLLADENQWVRRQAVECAIRIPDFPATSIIEMIEKEESSAVIESVMKFVVDRELKSAIPLVFDRIRREPEEELPWLISTLGYLGAIDELTKVKKFLGPVRTEIFSEYYQALLLNGDLNVFEEINRNLQDKKRDVDLLVWAKISGEVGAFVTRTGNYSKPLYEALYVEVQKDMQGVAILDAPVSEEPDEKQLESAITHYTEGNYLKAKEILEKVVESFSDNADANFYLASSLYNLGEVSKATERLFKGTLEFPKHLETAILLGQIYFRKKEWKKLIDCYEKVLPEIAETDKRNNIRVFGALGLAYFHQKKYEKAIEALNRGLKANPRDLSSSYHLALCYYAIGKTEQAKKILEGLRKTLPPDSKVLKNVIELLQRI
jgi:HEAT repeat protein/TolA-binding protein